MFENVCAGSLSRGESSCDGVVGGEGGVGGGKYHL